MATHTIDKTTYRSPNFWSPAKLREMGVTRAPRHVVLHDTEGTFPSDLNELLGKSSREVSAHYYIPKNGDIYELVDPDSAAWHAYVIPGTEAHAPAVRDEWGYTDNENFQSIGIEMEGQRNQPKTPAQIEACAWLVAYLENRYPAIKHDRVHIVGHYELNKDKVDPLPWDWDAFMAEVARRRAESLSEPLQNGNPTPSPSPNGNPPSDPHTSSGGQSTGPLHFPETGKTVRGGFRDFFEANGGIARLGYPLTDEIPHPETAGVTIQVFENGWLETWPGVVRFGAIGRYYLAAIGKR